MNKLWRWGDGGGGHKVRASIQGRVSGNWNNLNVRAYRAPPSPDPHVCIDHWTKKHPIIICPWWRHASLSWDSKRVRISRAVRLDYSEMSTDCEMQVTCCNSLTKLTSCMLLAVSTSTWQVLVQSGRIESNWFKLHCGGQGQYSQPCQHAQHQDPGGGSPKWNAAIVNVINHTCAPLGISCEDTVN